MRVVIDVDPGIDDALALFLALCSPELDLEGVTVVAGNVGVEQGTRNALALLDAVGHPEVPVYRGAAQPLLRRLTTATYIMGPYGLGNVELPAAARPAEAMPAAEYLVQAATRDASPLTVIAVGPLTNVALACRLDPSWPGRLGRLVIMGGAVSVPGNVTPVAEANFYADPEAAAIVLACSAPITLIGLDVTTRAHLPVARFPAMRRAAAASGAPIARLAVEVLDYYVQLAAGIGREGPALHDPLAVGVAFDPEVVTTERLHVEVETTGVLARGQSVAWLEGRREQIADRGDHDDVVGFEPVVGNVDVALEVDAERFLELFLTRLRLAGD